MHAVDDAANKAATAVEGHAMRRDAMAILAEGDTAELAGLVAAGTWPLHEDVRPAERGLVMVRAHAGGDGAPFNLGEATVTRAAVRLATGELGFGYVLGTDREKARLIALCDALLQSEQHRAAVEQQVIAPLRVRHDQERTLTAQRTAATRVEFFTLVRGEDK
jgi:alpha-D-ribose 1-methylphosphonate 5-triphosphate synthase subunit PhnG